MDCPTLASLYGFREPSTNECTIAQCSPSRCRLAWAREHRDWSEEDWKRVVWSEEDWKRVVWSDESRFRLLNTNGMLRIWRQAQEAMYLACRVGTVQGHGGLRYLFVALFGIFGACTTFLNEIWYALLLGDHFHPFMLFC
ncbi:uncharacterized protein TNCV_2707561 [Trichonephila clavipes]|nr:uncharacterized protein TNCV_2707561 [Trichonephila clavipes]